MRETGFEAPSWDYVYALLIELAEKIRGSGFKPDVILGVSRGGWIPARVLSDLLENPNLANIRVEFYSGIYETSKRPVITQPPSLSVKDKRVLIVDDIVDTGESIRLVYDELSGEAKEVKTATLYHKPWSILRPDYYSKDTSMWVVFPWELYETTKTLGNKMFEEGKSMEDIEEKLVGMGLDASIIKKLCNRIFGEARE